MSPKQKKFCDLYVQTGNGTQAAIDSGYSPSSARSIASENLTKPNIKKYISEQYRSVVGAPDLSVKNILEEIQSLYSQAKSEGKYSDALRACKLKLELIGNMKTLVEEAPATDQESSLMDEMNPKQKRRLLALMKHQHLGDDSDLLALEREASVA